VDKLVIKGGRQLNGDVYVSGSKNAALPIMAAVLLAEGVYNIRNVPVLKDIFTMGELLERLGVKRSFENGTLVLNNLSGGVVDAPYDLVKKMRASILVLGPLLAKRGQARVSLPGGCAIGERPVDLHIAALEKMGAEISVNHGYIEASCPCPWLSAAEINFKTVTVTGTENILMAAVLACGTTVISNAAAEPEVSDLADFLRCMGADITGDGTSVITVNGVEALHPADYSVMPDRIEAGTFMCAVAGAGGQVRLHNVPVKCMSAVIESLVTTGLTVNNLGGGVLELISEGKLNSADISTKPYPGFPTDMQAQYMAIMTRAEGTSLIDENIFENRFMHVAELKRMGADIAVKDGRAVVRGVGELSGAPVMASDLRASAGLVIAALIATNTSEINRVYHLDRGYQEFEKKLSSIGADIIRVSE
jgi:UDP-N-acetylglucosamine 1-carboxyvinyltransferase